MMKWGLEFSVLRLVLSYSDGLVVKCVITHIRLRRMMERRLNADNAGNIWISSLLLNLFLRVFFNPIVFQHRHLMTLVINRCGIHLEVWIRFGRGWHRIPRPKLFIDIHLWHLHSFTLSDWLGNRYSVTRRGILSCLECFVKVLFGVMSED